MPKLFDNFYSGKRVLITGHTGFKGAWLSMWLNGLGANVTGYALSPPTKPSLFEVCSLDSKVNSLIGDIRNLEMLTDVFEKHRPEIVFHMAAQSLVRHSYKEPVETYETNVMGTVNLLEACRHTPSVRVVVNITSDKCYDNRERVVGYRENDPLGGNDPYSSSKACAELVTYAYLKSFFNPDDHKKHGISLASARAGNVIGGGDWAEDRLIPDMVRAFLLKQPVTIRYPQATRPWQHVLEPLYGYLLLGQKLYEQDDRFSGAWNFGPNDEGAKPVHWVVERFSDLWGEDAGWKTEEQKQPHEAWYLNLDCTKAKTLLGWYPEMDVDAALNWTAQWYKIFRDAPDSISEFTEKQIREYTKIQRQKNK